MPLVAENQKRRWRRGFRRRRQNAVELSQQADRHIDRLLLRRFERLLSVKRFVLLWVLLFIALLLTTVFQTRSLSTYYQSLRPAPGGIFSEGIVGSFNNASPLYAASTADNAVSHLVFSSLLKYDGSNQLIGDLAQSWAEEGSAAHYTVHLRSGIIWHDGQPFDADDVLFTYQTIQNIASQSPLYNNWKDISIKKVDNLTVSFSLPSPLSSFPHSLTNGIVPKHLLIKIPPAGLRSAPFNTEPVGTGPFQWKYLEIIGTPGTDRQQRISLSANEHFYGGKPKLDGINLISFADEEKATQAFRDKQVNSIAGLETVPAELAKDSSLKIYTTPLTTAIMAFFNISHQPLNDPAVRQALAQAVDRSQLTNLTNYPVKLVDGPLLRGQLGYDSSVVQPGFDPKYVDQLLDQAGWKLGDKQIRVKNGQPLQLTLRSQNTKQYTLVSEYLQLKWSQIGVKINVQYHDADDLQAGIIANHDYDLLVYGINIGVDPDVFAFWDSSQANISSLGHMNLSEYKSTAADQALEGARTRSDTTLRAVKYKPFLTAWVRDYPALALYQPNFLYISRGPVFNYERKSMNTAADRFYNVQNWMIRQSRQTN